MTLLFISKQNKDTNLALRTAYLLFCDLFQLSLKPENPQIMRIEGKPYIENFLGHVSASHSGGFLVVAISRFPVGIDIEKIREIDYMKISNRFFQSNPLTKNEFFLNWCASEAISKATGKNLVKCLKEKKDNENLHQIDFISGYVLCCYSQTSPLIYFEN